MIKKYPKREEWKQVIFLKKLVFVLLSFLFFLKTFAYSIVPEDFYLENSSLHTNAESGRLLPNTLRLVLLEGERGELYAEVFPKNGGYCDVQWRISGDGAKIFPRENTCTVLGVHPCRETVTLSAEGKDSFEISVEVMPQKETRLRSFEYEGEKTKKGMSYQFMDFIAVFLGTGGVLFLVCAAAMFKGEKNEK